MFRYGKRVLMVFAAIYIGMMAAACDEKDPKKESNSKGKTTTTAASKDETFGLNETAVFSDLKIAAIEIKASGGSEYNKPGSGNVFVGVKFTIENISNQDQIISSILLFDAYADDVKSDLSITASMEFNSKTLDGTVAPGKKLIGYYTMEVPTTTKMIELNVKSDWLSNAKAKFVLDMPK
ncbi:MAG TPA: hypothetical protein DEB10_05715 [Ruminococcaceae bacterium]|nr:hypothetical protein [Oscillospiraceae bacterium]